MHRGITRKSINIILPILLVLISLIPVIRLIKIILTTGMNNLSNDYRAFTPVVINYLNNGFHLSNLGNACFRDQCEPLTFMVMTFIAKFFSWNVYAEMMFSIIITSISVLIIYFLFAGISFSKNKIWLLVILSGIGFSFTQIASFTFGQASIYPATTLFGLTICLVGYKFFPGSYKGLALLIIGMIIAAWSYGAGLIVIPLAFLALLLHFRKKLFVGIWFIGFCAVCVPYLEYFQYIQTGGKAEALPFNFFNYKFVIHLLGMFFSNGIGLTPNEVVQLFKSHQTLTGLAGLTLFIVCIILLFKLFRFRFIIDYFPQLCLALFGLGSIWQISIVRTSIASWYIVDGAPFWIGLSGLVFSIAFLQTADKKIFLILKYGTVIIYFLSITVFWINTNLSYEDKIFHLLSRSPASAACLQYYQTAPTYCEGSVFQWGVGNNGFLTSLASPLEQYDLSVFGPYQEKTLQGEYVFEDRVKTDALPTDITWWTGLDGAMSQWSDYKHLDVLIPAPHTVSWTVEIPEQLISADLKTAVGINYQAGVSSATENKVTFTIRLTSSDNQQVVFEKTLQPDSHTWTPVNIPLSAYAGQQIIIDFETKGDENGAGAWAMFQFPHIDLHVNPTPIQSESLVIAPDNTDLAESASAVQDSESVNLFTNPYVLSGTNATQSKADPSEWTIGSNPAFKLNLSNSACLPAYSDFLISLAVEPELSPRSLFIIFTLDNGQVTGFNLPLLADGEEHTYTYPLRLLNLSPGIHVTGIEIRISNDGPETYSLQFKRIEFIQADNQANWPYACGYPLSGIPPQTVTANIVAGDKVSQSFLSECQGDIDQIGLFFGTFGRKDTPPITIQILDQFGKTLDTTQLSTLNMADNQLHYFKIPPLEVSIDQSLKIVISAPQGTQNNAFVLYYSKDDKYPDGIMQINNQLQSGDLVFRYSCEQN